jgi:hypothetical protein
MVRNLAVAAMLAATLANASAGTVAIGTASARGDMRVDQYKVNGNATLFDGSVVETDQATADLRLDRGVDITMSTGSRATLFHDRIVLQKGASELTTSSPFQVDANNLRVTASASDARGVVAVKSGNMVEVAALSGSFGVTNDKGALLARVVPGHPLSFSLEAGAGAAASGSQPFEGTGILSKEADGNYLLSVGEVKFQITGSGLDRGVGKKVTIKGTTVPDQAPADGAVMVVNVSSVHGAPMDANVCAIIAWFVIAGAVGGGIAIWEANHPLSPISRQ